MGRPSSVRETSPVMESMENIWLDGILGVCSRRLKRSSPLTEPRSSRSRASTCINGIPETQAEVTKLMINTKRVNHMLPRLVGVISPLMKPFFISITIQTAPLKVLLPLRSPSWTLPRMLWPIKVGTLSFLSMTHTSTVKLWRPAGILKDTCAATPCYLDGEPA